MNYETRFDLAATPFPYEGPLRMIGIGIVALAFAAYRIYRMDMTFWGFLRNYKMLVLVFIGTGLIGYTVRNSWDFVWMRSAAANGKVEQIEGIVQDHWIKRASNDTFEHFRIGTVEFFFKQRDGDESFFNNGGRQKTELRDDMRLRIAYLVMGTDNNRIVKLEIAR